MRQTMANPLYNTLNNNRNNQFSQIIEQAKQMQKTFTGNPKAEVERLVQTGQMSQEQFNQFARIANQIMQFMPK